MTTGKTRPRIVLVRPQSGENIGFVIRLAANYELDPVHLVMPEPGWERGAARTASMCRELLAETRLHTQVEGAVHDSTEVLAFTAREGRDRAVQEISALGASVQSFAPDARVALLFGNEAQGLDREELSFSTARFRIPLPGLSSLNLSHAVSIALHVYSSQVASSSVPEEQHRAASVEDKERLCVQARATLDGIGFQVDDPHFKGALERLIKGARIETRDLRILHKILTHIEYQSD